MTKIKTKHLGEENLNAQLLINRPKHKLKIIAGVWLVLGFLSLISVFAISALFPQLRPGELKLGPIYIIDNFSLIPIFMAIGIIISVIVIGLTSVLVEEDDSDSDL